MLNNAHSLLFFLQPLGSGTVFRISPMLSIQGRDPVPALKAYNCVTLVKWLPSLFCFLISKMGGSKEMVTSSRLSWQHCVSEWVAASLHKEGHAFYLSFPDKGMRTPNRKICFHGTWPKWTTANDQTAMAEGELRNCPKQPLVCGGLWEVKLTCPSSCY